MEAQIISQGTRKKTEKKQTKIGKKIKATNIMKKFPPQKKFEKFLSNFALCPNFVTFFYKLKKIAKNWHFRPFDKFGFILFLFSRVEK